MGILLIIFVNIFSNFTSNLQNVIKQTIYIPNQWRKLIDLLI
jgi:hypothetical protein